MVGGDRPEVAHMCACAHCHACAVVTHRAAHRHRGMQLSQAASGEAQRVAIHLGGMPSAGAKRGCASSAASSAGSAKGAKRQRTTGLRNLVSRSVAGSDGPDIGYDQSHEGECQCAVCQAPSTTTEWAATRTQKSDGSTVALGNLCADCVEVWKLKKGKGLETLDAFVKKASKSADFRRTVEQTKLLRRGKGERSFSPEAVERVLEATYDVTVPYIAFNEREIIRLAKLGNVSRLPKYMVKDLVSIEAPKVGDPTSKETVFLFRHPSRPYREVTFRQTVGMKRCVEELSASSSVFEGQGDTVLSEANARVLDPGCEKQAHEKALSAGGMPTFVDFLHSIKAKQQKKASSSPSCQADEGEVEEDSEQGDDDREDTISVLSGPLAGMFIAPNAPQVSPQKNLPSVPMFGATPPGKCASSHRDPSLARSRAPSVAGSIGEDEDEEGNRKDGCDMTPKKDGDQGWGAGRQDGGGHSLSLNRRKLGAHFSGRPSGLPFSMCRSCVRVIHIALLRSLPRKAVGAHTHVVLDITFQTPLGDVGGCNNIAPPNKQTKL